MQRGSFFVRQLTTLFILTGLMGSLTGGQKKSAQPKPASCSGVWTGNVTYTRSQDLSDSKTVKRVSNRGEDQKSYELKFRYKASVAVLEDRNRPGANTGKASIESSLTSTDKTIAREENSCDRGKTWRVMTGEFITRSETRGQASHLDAIRTRHYRDGHLEPETLRCAAKNYRYSVRRYEVSDVE